MREKYLGKDEVPYTTNGKRIIKSSSIKLNREEFGLVEHDLFSNGNIKIATNAKRPWGGICNDRLCAQHKDGKYPARFKPSKNGVNIKIDSKIYRGDEYKCVVGSEKFVELESGAKPLSENISKEETKMNAKEQLKEKFSSLMEENRKMKEQIVNRETYEEDMNKVVRILEKLKEQVDNLEEEVDELQEQEDEEKESKLDTLDISATEGVTEETEEENTDELEEDATTPQDEPAVNKNMEKKKRKKEDATTPQDEPAVSKNLEQADGELEEDATTPQDEPAVNKNMEQADEDTIEESEDEETKKEMEDTVEEQDELEESDDELEENEEPTPPIEENLSLKDLDSRDNKFGNHLKEVFNFK